MTDTPSPQSNPAGSNKPTGTGEPTGESAEHGAGEELAARPGQHEGHDPRPLEPGAGHGRHEMAGQAGYPQFEGPGAAQYGEPVEAAPPVREAAPGQPSYGPPGTGPMPPGAGGGQPTGGTEYPGGPPQTTGGQYPSGPQTPGAVPPPGDQYPSSAQTPGAMPPGGGQYPAGTQSPGTMPPPGAQSPGGQYPGGQYPGDMQTPGMMPPPGNPPPGAPPQPAGPTYGYQGATPGVPSALDVGNALSYGWAKFRGNVAPWLGITAVGIVLYLAFVLIVQVVEPESLFTLLLIFLVVMVGIWLLQAAMIRGALYENDGNKPTFASYFHFVNAGNVLLTALLAFALTWIGAALCLVPGLIAGFLCMFALHFVVDQDYGPIDAIKASATLVISNIGQVLLLAIAVIAVTLVATLLCGFGLLVAGPVCTIAVTFAYRRLTGGIVSAL